MNSEILVHPAMVDVVSRVASRMQFEEYEEKFKDRLQYSSTHRVFTPESIDS